MDAMVAHLSVILSTPAAAAALSAGGQLNAPLLVGVCPLHTPAQVSGSASGEHLET